MQAEIHNVELPSLPARNPKRRRLALRFGGEVDEIVRRRMSYVMRTFCTVFDYDYVAIENFREKSYRPDDALTISYGRSVEQGADIRLAAGYHARPHTQPASEPAMVTHQGEAFPCFHPTANGEIDWLGEIFEWISAADEQAIEHRDAAGRIPFDATLHGRYGLDPAVPYASVAMEALRVSIEREHAAWNRGRAGQTESLRSGKCAIVATHDVDFLPVSTLTTIKRYFKYMAIAAVAYRDARLTTSIILSGLARLGRKPHVLDCLLSMLKRERELGISSTCNLLCRQAHRRDADYQLNDPATLNYLREMARHGAEIGLHGSYTSLDAPGRLAEEYQWLSQQGYEAAGGRQHWLRYQNHELFDELLRAGANYDCSVGYSEHVGFRTGACFAYAPYNFLEETSYPLLEIPLVLMDSALYCTSRDPKVWSSECHKVLQAVRRYGRGGVSVLWHDTVFQGGQLPQGIADLYWTLKRSGENWISAQQLVAEVWPQFARSGLLPQRIPTQVQNRAA